MVGDGISDDSISSGYDFPYTDYYKMQYELNKIDSERAWQEDMYNKYQSIPAQVQQMKAAGLNPALMYGSGASGGSMPSSSTGGGTPATGIAPNVGAQKAQMVMQMITSLLGAGGSVASQISGIQRNSVMNTLSEAQTDEAEAHAENYRVDSDLKRIERSIKEVESMYAEFERSLAAKETQARIREINSRASLNFSSMQVNTSTIEVNNHRIELIDAQASEAEKSAALKGAQKILTNIQSEQMSVIASYQEQLMVSQLKLQDAQSESLRADAEKSLSQVSLNALEYLKQEQLLDSGYVDQIIKGMKTERGTAIANTVLNGVFGLVNAVADFTPMGRIGNALFPPVVSRAGFNINRN